MVTEWSLWWTELIPLVVGTVFSFYRLGSEPNFFTYGSPSAELLNSSTLFSTPFLD